MNNYGLESKELVFYGDSHADLHAAEAFEIPFYFSKK